MSGKKPIPFGKYYLLERINVGGMAEVFKAKSYGIEGFERIVAVKRILPSIAEDEEFIQMFLDEAKIAVQLTHANIAQTYDLGRVGDSYYIAIEYIHGKDLRSIYDRAKKNNEKLPVPMSCYVIMKVCEGLDYAHNKKDAAGRSLNLVHRDVSPQNILISYEGESKLIDFGIAKAANKLSKTQAGILKGKFGYMSPEQVRGLPLDKKSDIFSTGIVLYELLTGERLFQGESDFSVLEKVRNVEIMPPTTYNTDIPEELEKIVLKALAKEVEDRYQSAMELHDDLQSFMYTSGNFFGRKELSSFMRKMFPEEAISGVSEESEDDLESQIPSISTSSPKSERASRPIIKRPTAPPPPPGKGTTSTASKKSTLLGVPQSQPQSQPFKDEEKAFESEELKKEEKTTPPPLPGKKAKKDSLNIEWDEEELETQVYDKPSDLLDKNYDEIKKELASAKQALKDPTEKIDVEKEAISEPEKIPSFAGPPKSKLPEYEEEKSFDDVLALPSSPLRSPLAKVQQDSSKKNNLIIGISTLSALLIIVVFLLIYSYNKEGTVGLTVFPTEINPKVELNGKILPLDNGILQEKLKPGDYEFVISAEGYNTEKLNLKIKPGEQIIKVVKLTSNEVKVVQVKNKTGISIFIEPINSLVKIDGDVLPVKTPIEYYELQSGEHEIEITHDGYATYKENVRISDGETIKLIRSLQPSEFIVKAQIDPQDSRCVIEQAGKEILLTAGEAKILPGLSARLKCMKKGYLDLERELHLSKAEGNIINVNETMQELKRIEVANNVNINQNVKNNNSAKISNKNKIVKQVEVNNNNKVEQTNSNGPGYLSLNTTPWTVVYIDGQRIRNTPLINYPLSSGEHRLRCVNPDFGIDSNFNITIQAGQPVKLVKNLISGGN